MAKHRRSASDAVQSNTNRFFSDEEQEEEETGTSGQIHAGFLYKWTNYIHGWQPRYFSLADGLLTYYKNENDTAFGCRGAIKLDKALIAAHEFDECRFEISVNDSNWYLRAENKEDRVKWMETLEAYKSSRGLAEKLAELETFRDIVVRQVDTLQAYFDRQAAREPADARDPDSTMEDEDFRSLDSNSPVAVAHAASEQTPSPLPDFKGEALTFKATTSGILATIEHCIELVQQREETWKKKLEREVERRKRAEDQSRHAHVELIKVQGAAKAPGPDFEEGPNSALNEEEWHDAVDAALDREDIEQERILRMLSHRTGTSSESVPCASGVTLTRDHRLFNEVPSFHLHDDDDSTGRGLRVNPCPVPPASRSPATTDSSTRFPPFISMTTTIAPDGDFE